LTREEVARRLRVHPSTVDNWRKRYGLPTIEKGSKVYFDWPEVKAWLHSGPMKAGRRKKAARSSGGKRSREAGGKELELALCGDAAAERRAEA
jgi:transposase-like protein